MAKEKQNDDTPTACACACACCGHEQATMDPCARCRSVRVVLVSVLNELLGENWRKAFVPDEAP